jgi:hypothetical protein
MVTLGAIVWRTVIVAVAVDVASMVSRSCSRRPFDRWGSPDCFPRDAQRIDSRNVERACSMCMTVARIEVVGPADDSIGDRRLGPGRGHAAEHHEHGKPMSFSLNDGFW